MRLDYTLYALGALILIITAVPFVITIEGFESDTRNLWVVSTVVLGLLSVGLGYSQRPKTVAQACQPTATVASQEKENTVTAAPQETVTTKTQEAAIQEQTVQLTETPAPVALTLELTEVKGIGAKRAAQLKALGINNVSELANASAEDIAGKLQISSKIAQKWIDNARELVK
ncbi:MAG: helix-hairpin-helix domain-containing protein [Candidatus Bathyarchaeota archaeon]|nr:helix-hairpin-helix domain-containing protein [Candidatus Bathyarchaeota archaeon]